MELIQEWRSAWKWFSVQAMALATAIIGTWAVLPDDWKTQVPQWAVHLAAVVALAAGIVGRVVDQSNGK